jgi:PKD repeat protein
VDFDAASSSDNDGSIAAYAWTFGDGGSASGVAPSHTYNTVGTYTAQLAVTDDDGATATATRTIQVSASAPASNEPPTAGFYSTRQSGEPPLDVDVYAWYSSDPDGSIVSYVWDFGDGASASGYKASHTYTNLGTYTITLTVTDNDGATDDAAKQVSVSIGGC